jgi:hypothetical protein
MLGSVDDTATEDLRSTIAKDKDAVVLRVAETLAQGWPRIHDLGTNANLAVSRALDDKCFGAIRQINDQNFIHLFRFFESRSANFDVNYTSMTIRDKNYERLGTKAVLEAVLP